FETTYANCSLGFLLRKFLRSDLKFHGDFLGF
ncbi:MAG: hypothetical protein ACI9W2_000707, partial [Gammaproteobacteria bacterium]